MAEELTSATSAPSGPDAGQPEGQAQETAPSSTAEAPEGEQEVRSSESSKTKETKSEKSKPNWYDDPEFRRQQSERDRALNEAKRQNQQLQQQMQEMQQRFEGMYTQGMSESERANYYAQQAQQQAQYYQQLYAAAQEEQAKLAVLREIAALTELDDVDALMDKKLDEAWVTGVQHMKKQNAELRKELEKLKRFEEREKKEGRNDVDLGGGISKSHSPNAKEALRDAKTPMELAKLLF